MYCPKCKTENENNALFCEKCGTKLEGGDNLKPKKLLPEGFNKNIIIGILMGIIACAILVYVLLPKTPKKDQLKADFLLEVLDGEDVTISNMTIKSEEKLDNKYIAIVTVVYADAKIEYNRKYRFSYVKNKKWMLADIESLDAESWEMKAIVEPSEEELGRLARDAFLGNSNLAGEIMGYQETLKDVSVDLDNQKVICTFLFKSEDVIRVLENEVEFQYSFQKNWEITEQNIISEKISIKTGNVWSGVAVSQSISYQEKYGDIEVKMNILSEDDGEVTAEFTFGDNEPRKMSGTISGLNGWNNNYSLEITDNADEKYCVKGTILRDGKFTGFKDNNYNKDAIFYFRDDRWDLELYIE